MVTIMVVIFPTAGVARELVGSGGGSRNLGGCTTPPLSIIINHHHQSSIINHHHHHHHHHHHSRVDRPWCFLAGVARELVGAGGGAVASRAVALSPRGHSAVITLLRRRVAQVGKRCSDREDYEEERRRMTMTTTMMMMMMTMMMIDDDEDDEDDDIGVVLPPRYTMMMMRMTTFNQLSCLICAATGAHRRTW
jgi:hypothetical protein